MGNNALLIPSSVKCNLVYYHQLQPVIRIYVCMYVIHPAISTYLPIYLSIYLSIYIYISDYLNYLLFKNEVKNTAITHYQI